ncbi:MAG: sialidase family protein [Chloroflexota bacterium]
MTQVYEGRLGQQPILVGDRNGSLHLLWSGTVAGQTDDEPVLILYTYWKDGVWSEPIDVILSPEGTDTRYPAAFLDSNDILHLIFGGSALYYTSVPVWQAGNASHWAPVRLIGNGDVLTSSSGFLIDANGVFHVTVADSSTRQVRHYMSTDEGNNWLETEKISTVPAQTGTIFTGLAIDSQQTLHAIWTKIPLPESYPPLGVFTARSYDGGFTWTPEQELAGENYGEATITVDAQDNIHVLFNGRVGTGGKYHLLSTDQGKTWSEPAAIVRAGLGGLNGQSWLTLDNNNHLFFTGGSGEGMWTSRWQDGYWEPATDLRPLASTILSETERSIITTLAGNQIHIVFEDSKSRLWHTWRATTALQSGVIPYPTIASLAPSSPETTAALPQSDVQPTPSVRLLPLDTTPSPTVVSPGANVLQGVALSVSLLVTIIAYQMFTQRFQK